ncbi:hypothetical protein SO694_00022349 [Aureococcus anophagefferens]|uniref:RGS domain-containing protein n=1 Tax=Aureococcus anophagefferens TaxID=44056 RepID=A0ABR1FT47_AURAN
MLRRGPDEDCKIGPRAAPPTTAAPTPSLAGSLLSWATARRPAKSGAEAPLTAASAESLRRRSRLPRQGRLTIHDLLRSEVLLQHDDGSAAPDDVDAVAAQFAAFVRERFAYELVEFYLRVERYRRCGGREAAAVAASIAATFVARGAPREVNVSDAARHAALQRAAGGAAPQPDAFDALQAEVVHILAVDFLTPFLKETLDAQKPAKRARRRAASCGRDDFREMSTGKTKTDPRRAHALAAARGRARDAPPPSPVIIDALRRVVREGDDAVDADAVDEAVASRDSLALGDNIATALAAGGDDRESLGLSAAREDLWDLLLKSRGGTLPA